MKKQKEQNPKEVLEIVENMIKAEYTSVLREAADQGAKKALEIINGSTSK
ncbi:hypothetical protein JZU61_04245 [bacterium]|nr:hypothetical protein [bacterium]MBV5348851.1 hypothetical protein [bacterium]